MKKFIFGLLIFLLVFGGFSFPKNASAADAEDKANAYKAVVKVKTYVQDEEYNLTQYGEGSGVIFTSDGFILTNYHVVTVESEFDGSEMEAVYQICIPFSTENEPDCSFVGKFVYKDKDLDIAILKIEPIVGLSTTTEFPYLNLAASDNVAMSDPVTVIGYPSIGGGTITVSEGTVNGKENKYNKKWIKTDAMVSFGSSGGAIVNEDGTLIGVTTGMREDMTGSMGYAVNMVSLLEWINMYKTRTPVDSSLRSDLEYFSNKTKSLKTDTIYTHTEPAYEITRPVEWQYTYITKNYLAISNESNDDGGVVTVSVEANAKNMSLDNIVPLLNRSFNTLGYLSRVELIDEQVVTIGGRQAKKITFSFSGSATTAYFIPVRNYLIAFGYDYGLNDQDKGIVDNIIDSFNITDSGSYTELHSHTHQSPFFSITTNSSWPLMTYNSKENILSLMNKNIPEAIADIQVGNLDDREKGLTNQEFVDEYELSIDTYNLIYSYSDSRIDIVYSDPAFRLNDNLTNVIKIEYINWKISTGKKLSQNVAYFIKSGDKLIIPSVNIYSQDSATINNAKAEFETALQALSSSSSSPTPTPPPAPTPNPNPNPNPNPTPPGVDNKLVERVKGKLLLQVEDRGRIWYVDQINGQKWEVTFANALNLFESLALGITNGDLSQIAMHPDSVSDTIDSDNDGFTDREEVLNGYNPEIASDPTDPGNDKFNLNSSLATRLKGRLLLQVEDRGRIWYIDMDGKRHEVTWKNLMGLFESLALGITNSDLSKISNGI
jgi:V8-like Glu-specific endopeptidase